MKKLMVMAVVAVAAVCSQAATFAWTGSYTSDASGGYAPDGLPVYLFVASVAGVGYDHAGTALTAGSWRLTELAAAVTDGSLLSGGWLDKAVDTTTVNSSMYTGGSADYTGIANGTDVLFAAIFVDTMSKTPDTYAAYLAAESAITLDIISGLGEWDSGFSSYGMTYTAQSVPEPTSGLLLLLGVAGLALRRRRA